MRRRGPPNIPPVIALPGDTTASDALLRDILDVLKENKAYQLAVLEQQNQIHDSLTDINRSLLTDREHRYAQVEELSLELDGLREDLNRFFVRTGRVVPFGPSQIPPPGFKPTGGTGRRSSRSHRPTVGGRRPQTPRPSRRQSQDLVDSSDEDPLEADIDPNRYRYSEPVPVRRSYTPALIAHPGIPSVTTGTTGGSSRNRLTPPNHPRPESRQQPSQRSSGLTYVSDDPAVPPPPPPGFVPHRQRYFPTPRVPFQQSPLHHTPVPPPPQMQLHRDRPSNDSDSES